MNETNYFDMQDVLINELVGDLWLFLFIGLLLVVIIALKNRMPWQITSLLAIIWVSIVFAADTGLVILWVMAVLASGGLFYYGMSKLINR